jgi:uncharacterized protein (TIGR02996 family)
MILKVVSSRFYINNPIDIDEDFGVIMVLKGRQYQKVLKFIQHVGYNLSSRLAEDYLYNLGKISNLLTFADEDIQTAQSESFSRAVALDPTNPTLRLIYGDILDMKGKPDQALQQYESAVAFRPTYAGGFLRLARFYAKRGDLVRSKNAYEKTLFNLPSDSPEYIIVEGEIAAVVKALQTSTPATIPPGSSTTGPEETNFMQPGIQ